MDFEADDFMADPEHIFRESSMVVRTDEPTSIIALTLKCVTDYVLLNDLTNILLVPPSIEIC